MADVKWAKATALGQTPDRLWHTPDGPAFQIDAGKWSDRWMREATKAEIEAAGGHSEVVDVDGTTTGDGKDMETMTDEQLRDHYEAVMGEKAHHAAGRDTMIKRITEKLNDD